MVWAVAILSPPALVVLLPPVRRPSTHGKTLGALLAPFYNRADLPDPRHRDQRRRLPAQGCAAPPDRPRIRRQRRSSSACTPSRPRACSSTTRTPASCSPRRSTWSSPVRSPPPPRSVSPRDLAGDRAPWAPPARGRPARDRRLGGRVARRDGAVEAPGHPDRDRRAARCAGCRRRGVLRLRGDRLLPDLPSPRHCSRLRRCLRLRAPRRRRWSSSSSPSRPAGRSPGGNGMD